MCEILLQGLSEKGKYQVIHLDSSDKRSNVYRGKIDFVNIAKALSDSIQLIIKILRYKPYIVYMTTSNGFEGLCRDILFIIPAKLLGTKIVCHHHSRYFDRDGILRKMLISFVFRKVDVFLVLGKRIEQRLRESLPTQNFEILYNGIDPIPQMKLKKSGERFRVLFIGSLRESKGIFDLLESAAIVLEKTEHIDFWIAGEWESHSEQNQALSLIRQKQIESHVKFLGLITGDEKNKFFNQGDVYVHPTHHDAHPIVILEAMSIGLPVISTDIGSIPETVVNGENGFIIPKGKPHEIAEKILMLYHNQSLKMKMSLMSQKIYNTRFTSKKCISNIEQVFDRLFKNRERPLIGRT